ncbi:MAG: hypothetical protein R3325_04915 [Thermoanaerobaculia bacterium]|nr:hypothetical protein [Thermoanaerobaculia bacterium]
MTRTSQDRRVFYGVALTAFATLVLQVVFTRIFSAMMYYHFTFLAISLTLLGIGVSGVFVYIRGDRFRPEGLLGDLARYSRLFAVSTVVALAYVLANPIAMLGPDRFLGSQAILQLVLFNGAAALPFFFGGVVISLAILHYSRQINRLYAFDMCGAAAGCLAAAPLLLWLGGPSLVLLVAVLAALAAVLFERPRRLQWAPLVVTAGLLLLNLAWPLFQVPSVKLVSEQLTLFERWNTFSRVTVERLAGDTHSIKIDSSAATFIADADDIGDPSWRKQISALGYAMFPEGPETALIIGPGGGRDVVHALSAGTDRVIGVELNPLIAEEVMRHAFVEVNGDLYRHPQVEIITDEGRNFIRRSDESYDVIQATLVDTWAATASGAFALAENNLYTVEAFRDYLDHVTENGIVTFTRWYRGRTEQSQRLVVLAAAALEARGVAPGETRKHLYFAVHSGKGTYGGKGTLLVSKTPFTGPEIRRLNQAAREAGFRVLLSPWSRGKNQFERLVDAGAWSDYLRSQPSDLSPPTDDRPFFFYFAKRGDLLRVGEQLRTNLVQPAMWILLALGGAITALVVGFILVPLVALRLDALRGEGGSRRGVALFYFALIGLAFITVEIALLQKLTLLLGHPTYALLVVLFSLLLGTAAGARGSGMLASPPARLGLVAGTALAAVCLLLGWTLGPAVDSAVGWPLTVRILLAGLLTLGCGVLMGFMLPTGIRLAAERDQPIVPWAWGVNGATSVVGTVLATVCAITFGFSWTLIAGGVAYALAALTCSLWGGLIARGAAPATARPAPAGPGHA